MILAETQRERAVTPEQFEREVVDLLPRLLATARRLTRNQAAAEDLVAEAVSRAWQRIDSLRDAGNFAGWLYRILTNTYISERRRRTAEVDLEALDSDADASEFSLFERLHQPFLLWWSNPEQAFL